MSYLYINLFNQRRPLRLSPDEAIIRLQEDFPEAIVLPGDQLALTAQRAERNLDQATAANQVVVQKLWWDAQHLGPAYAFYIPAGAEPRIEGVIRRFQADFQSDGVISKAMHARIAAFLRSLIPEGAAIDVCQEPDDQEATAPPPR